MSVRSWSTVVVLAAAASLAGGGVDAADTAPGAVVETVLDNGLRVVLQPRHEVPMVAVTSIVGAGSALEDEAFSGASHFLEHLCFNGTSTMDQETLYDAVDRIGGYNNAHTDEDHTYFTMLVPSEHAREGLSIQAAMLFDSTLPEDKFDKERGIILEEIARDRSRPGHDAGVAERAGLWTGTAYARPVIGTYDSLAGIGLDRVRAYWQERYVPGNTLLWVLGDFDSDRLLADIRATYGSFDRPGGPPALPDPFAGAPAPALVRTPVDDPTPRIAIALPAPGPCEPGGAAAALLAARLSAEDGPLRRVLGLDRATAVGAMATARPRGSALVVRAELVEGGDPAGAAAELLAALERVARDGLATPGLEPASLLRTARAGRADGLRMAQRIHYVGMMQADAVASCAGSVAAVVGDSGEAVDPEAVARVARDVLSDARGRARVVLVGPELEPYGPGPLELPEIAPAPTDATTAASAPVPAADLDRTLPSGLRVLVGREPGAAITGIHVLVRDRAAREPAGRAGIADVVHRLLPHGTALADRAQLASRLERIGAELKTADSDFIPYDDYYTSPTHGFVRLEVPSERWLAALDLLAETVRTARLADDDLANLLPARIQRAEKEAASPSTAGSIAYSRAMLGDGAPGILPVGGTPDTLGGIDGATLRAFAADYLAPEGLIVSVVGPHEPEDVAGAIAERFPEAPAGVAWDPAPAWPVTSAPGEPVVVEVGGEQSRLYLGRIAAASTADRAALRVLAGVLSDRLARTVREELGLAYSLGASVGFTAEPAHAWMSVRVGTRPENLEQAQEAIRAEMDRLRATMASEEEIDRIRTGDRARALMRRMSAINRARLLGVRAFNGVPSSDDVDMLDAMDAVGRDDLVRLAKDWLDPDTFRVVIAR